MRRTLAGLAAVLMPPATVKTLKVHADDPEDAKPTRIVCRDTGETMDLVKELCVDLRTGEGWVSQYVLDPEYPPASRMVMVSPTGGIITQRRFGRYDLTWDAGV